MVRRADKSPQERVQDILEQLVEQFPSMAPSTVRAFRDQMERDREKFREAAFAVLRAGSDSPGTQYLLALLATNDMLFRWLGRPDEFTREQAIHLTRRLMKLDPATQSRLVGALSEMRTRTDADPIQMIQLLEIVDAISEYPNAPLLIQFLNSNDHRLRSKAALLMGRSNQNVRWVEQQLDEADPRVRGNAIEALWGAATGEACGVFRRALRDPHQRVAGNAAIGLYRAGEVESLRLLVEMASSPDPVWRATGAWAMGEAGDARFLQRLAKMISEKETNVRQNAFRAIKRVRQSIAPRQKAGEFEAVAFEAAAPDAESRRLRLTAWQLVPAGAPRRAGGLKALDFVPMAASEPMRSYTLTETPDPGAFTLAVLVPRVIPDGAAEFWRPAFESLAREKRRQDVWAVLKYNADSEGAGSAWSGSASFSEGPSDKGILKLGLTSRATEAEAAPEYTGEIATPADPQQLISVFEQSSAQSASASGLAQGIGQLIHHLSRATGERHLLVLAEPDIRTGDLADLALCAGQHRVRIHVCIRGPEAPEPLRMLASQTDGVHAAHPAPISVLPAMCRSFSGYYELTWPSEDELTRLEIVSDRGCGEVVLPNTGRPGLS